jgi:hypothetical protein
LFGQSTREERKLREHGQQAPAEVLEAKEGRWARTSGNPQLVDSTQQSWTLRLRVEPEGQSAFEAEVHTYLGQLDMAQPGRRFTVLYELSDLTRVAIDHSQSGAVDAVAQRIASRHAGADAISALLQKRIRDPNSVSAGDLAAGSSVPWCWPPGRASRRRAPLIPWSSSPSW